MIFPAFSQLKTMNNIRQLLTLTSRNVSPNVLWMIQRKHHIVTVGNCVYGCNEYEIVNVNRQNDREDTALICEARSYKCSDKIVEILLSCGADPNVQNIHGWTSLMHASRNPRYPEKITEMLLESSLHTDPNIQNIHGETALMLASSSNHLEGSEKIVRILLTFTPLEPSSRVNVNLRDNFGNTALMLASSNRKFRISPGIIMMLRKA